MKLSYHDAYIPISNEKITRRVLAHDGTLMLVHMTFHVKNDDPGMHSHPHEQIVYVEKGKFEFIKEDGSEPFILTDGDSAYFEPNVKHGARVLEDNSVLLDIFTPIREDFLPK
ncbi:MAG: cupin domain-containing protein [Oscillospiraceae bacterium]|nr:cupin domain-containing protein [Oscillospiraceae bacterium]